MDTTLEKREGQDKEEQRSRIQHGIDPLPQDSNPGEMDAPSLEAFEAQLEQPEDSGSSQLMAGGWNQITFTVSSNPKHSRILW